MARCGCSDTCNCVITATDPITVTGTGSAANPYVVGAFYSGDADNIAGPGSDGGIYVPGSGGGGGGGGATVAGLPATGVVGAWRLGAAMAPENTLDAARISHNGGADILHVDLRTGAETAGGFYLMADDTFDRTTTMNDAPPDTARPHAGMVEFGGFVDGNNTSWWSGNASSGTGQFTDPARLLSYQMPLFVDVLERFSRRVVIMPHIQRQNTVGTRTDLGSMILPYITRYGAQQSVIVLADALDDLAPIVAANIAAGINLRSSDDVVDYPASAVLAAGVDWVVMWPGADDFEISPYVAAGLHVLIANSSRHVQRDRATSLNCRGVLSADPIYTAETFTPLVNQPATSFYIQHNTFRYGTLGELADDGLFHLNSRGRPTSGTYWNFPQTVGGGGAVDYTVLAGSYQLRPELGHNLSSWRFQHTIQWNTAPNNSGGNVGVFICCPDDGSIYVPGTGTPSDTANGYRIRWMYSGTVEVHKFVNGVITNIFTNTWRASSAVVGTAYSVSFQVNPTNITLYTTIGQTLIGSVTDSQHRGPYMHIMSGSAVRAFDASVSPRDLISPGL